MGRAPCCDKKKVKKGAWSPEEDCLLVRYIRQHGHGNWRNLPKLAGLRRCGKSCRLRWTNYLRPDIRRGPFAPEEEAAIIRLQSMFGNKWAAIAAKLPGRTDNEIKNFWNTHLKKRLHVGRHNLQISQSPISLEPNDINCESLSTRHMIQWENARLEAEAHLPTRTLPIYASATCKTDCDVFLRLWNSEAGESFRKISSKDGLVCQSPTSQTSSSTKLIPNPFVKVKAELSGTSAFNETTISEQKEGCKTDLDSMNSNEFSDSEDTTLKLLLDFPYGNDVGFLEEQADSFPDSLNIR